MCSFQPRPMIHSPGVFFATAAFTRSRQAAMEVRSRRSTRSRYRPKLTKCRCASTIPGTTSRPGSSKTWAFAPQACLTSALLPTATTRPSRMATASAHGLAGSPW